MEAAGAPASNLMREVMAVEIEDGDGSATLPCCIGSVSIES
jgi:hypothetical protein